MSCLAKLPETKEWIASWKGHYLHSVNGTENLAARFERVAREQRANFESCVRGRRFPRGYNEVEYRRCVELLEKEARDARYQADYMRQKFQPGES